MDISKEKLYRKFEIAKLLEVSYTGKLKKIFKEYNFHPVLTDENNIEYYQASVLEFLINKQNELYQYFNETYYTYAETISLSLNVTSYDLNLSNPIEIPNLIKIKKFQYSRLGYEIKALNKRIEQKEILQTSSSYSTREVLLLFNFRDIEKLLKENNIEPIIKKQVGRKFYRWSKKEIDNLLIERTKQYNYFDKNFLTNNEVKELLNITLINSILIKKANLVTEKLPSLIKYNRFQSTHIVYTKNSIMEYIEFKKEKEKNILKSKLEKKKKINLKNEMLLNNFITLTNISDLLGLSLQITKEVLKENDLEPKYINNSGKHYLKSAIHLLKENQDLLYKTFEKEYMTMNEIRSEKKIGLKPYRNLTSISVPKIIMKGKYKSKIYVYPKVEIEELYVIRKKEQHLKEILKDVSIPFPVFEKLISEKGINFSPNATLTKKYWTSFVRQKLNKTQGSKANVKVLINRLVTITGIIANSTIEKEIFSYSTNELNLLFFNTELYLDYQVVIFSFFNVINDETHFNIFDFAKLKNPNIVRRSKVTNNKQVYSPKQFIELLDYASKVELHKQNAIIDINNALKNIKKYKKYDSAWLYVLLHLNNGWRSSDFTYKIPRLELPPNISINTDFSKNPLSSKEAKLIIVQLSSKLQSFKHSKNRKSNYFFCSEELEYPLANALMICELRTRLINPNNIHLIDFMNEDNEMLTGTQNLFFSNYSKDFKFGSLKMNRTFMGLMTDVIKKKTNRNPLEITKFIRNHTDIETTNVYIDIPQEHLDYISSQLFDKGYFGYTYDLFLKVLLESDQNDPISSINKSNIIKNVFGDIYNIENLSKYINHLEKEDEALLNYLKTLTKKELLEKMLLINLGQLPAKEENYQCIFGKCIFLERDCSRCPFSIPHFYALTKIGENIVKRLNDYKEIHNNSMYLGEKVRISNLLISDLLILSYAKEKFGEDVLSAFINIEYAELKKQIKSLPNPYEYMSNQ
ncbi:hypothetical protein [Paenisporosarcina quisquiliarum]|uniref:hypothetical protein n=1 Tax=Paenisporosarcina quisquiliarum TaxID=365346 RepID=UPI003736E10D